MDPKKPEKSKQAYVLRGFGLAKNAKLKGDEQVSIEEFVDTLSRG